MRGAKNELERLNARVLDVSGDTVEALERFRGKYKLNFPLAGDTSHRTPKAYGVWQEKNICGRKSFAIVRTTYLIASDGRISHVFPKVRIDGHIEQVLAALRLVD